ncbi:acylneuraminate cytidylyltransferase family protein [Amylibacter sp.]|nr:acylneuraminate cytidylyltransferase family protein [Amylibacter sp.]
MSKVVALVTARSGSKGLPHKNVAVLNGITLLEQAVEVGMKSKLVNEVFISTDSKAYEHLACSAGANSLGLRSDLLSGDEALSIDVIQDFIKKRNLNENDILVLLQPTSPIRNSDQIDMAVELHIKHFESVTTVALVNEPNPYKLKILSSSGSLQDFISGSFSEQPRQSLPSVYQLTGAIYVSSVQNIICKNSLYSDKTIPIIVDEFANIDTAIDLEFLKFRCAKGLKW